MIILLRNVFLRPFPKPAIRIKYPLLPAFFRNIAPLFSLTIYKYEKQQIIEQLLQGPDGIIVVRCYTYIAFCI